MSITIINSTASNFAFPISAREPANYIWLEVVCASGPPRLSSSKRRFPLWREAASFRTPSRRSSSRRFFGVTIGKGDLMLDQNVLQLDAIHPDARRNQTVVLPPPKNSSEANVFAAAILDDATTHRRRPLDLAISLVFHAGLLTVVLLLPLFFSTKLDVHVAAATFLVAPPPPVAAPPPPPAAIPRTPRTPPKEIFTPGKLTAPSFVPQKVAITAESGVPRVCQNRRRFRRFAMRLTGETSGM